MMTNPESLKSIDEGLLPVDLRLVYRLVSSVALLEATDVLLLGSEEKRCMKA